MKIMKTDSRGKHYFVEIIEEGDEENDSGSI